MKETLRLDAEAITARAIEKCLPDAAVKAILKGRSFSPGSVVLVAVGKAAWKMAAAAKAVLGDAVRSGVVITKYGHSEGGLPGLAIVEAGHPLLDENSLAAARRAEAEVAGLAPEDTVLFLLSGGGSALFEDSELSLAELQDINAQLLACGADIHEINTVRKHLSRVKGGRFAALCQPAKVLSILLSDIIDSDETMIASGPTCADPSTSADALRIVEKYGLRLSGEALALLEQETPKTVTNGEIRVCGSVQALCREAEAVCRELGYEPILLTDQMDCTARDAGAFLGAIAKTHAADRRNLAFLAGGETVVKLTGTGKGGRNQEIALAAAEALSGLPNAAVFSVGSDGTDGPTDAAGGYADGDTAAILRRHGLRVADVLQNNDAYHALQKTGGLLFTGPTGTNVNDVSVVLIRAEKGGKA